MSQIWCPGKLLCFPLVPLTSPERETRWGALGAHLHSQIVATPQGGGFGKAPGDSDDEMSKSRAAPRPTEPERGGLGNVWGSHLGDSLGVHRNCKIKQGRRQQTVFCSSIEDDPRSRWSCLPPSAQQVSAGAWRQRVQERRLGREQLMWGNGHLCTQLNRTRTSLAFKGWLILNSSSKRWSPAVSPTRCTFETSQFHLESL